MIKAKSSMKSICLLDSTPQGQTVMAKKISQVRKILGVAAALLLSLTSQLMAAAPDLTVTDPSTINIGLTWNLGPTGMRGWIYLDPGVIYIDDVSAWAPYQILVTVVCTNTPAYGIMTTNDVILGASAGTGDVPLFTADARKSLGWAIGDAEASTGILKIKRWRAGVTDDVSITLPVMGAYSATAPYNCPKSALIMTNAANSLFQWVIADDWGQDDGRSAVSALALMATGITNYMPMVQAYARRLAPTNYVAGGSAWSFYNGVFLAEYYMLTGDAQVFHGLSEYVKYAAKNSDLCGTTGHGFATIPPPGGFVDGRHGAIMPYGALNQAGLIAQLTIVLGKKAGVTDPEIDPAIARTAGFFGHFVNGGSVPYGETQPYWGEHRINGVGPEYLDYRSNGKDGLCAVLFACMDNKPAQAEYFARMCVAGTRGEAYGHTGQGFAYLWTQLGANMGGTNAAAAFAKNKFWDRDMKRRCDGSFVYEGGEQWGAGQANDYWHPSGYWYKQTAAYLLHAAMPLKKLYITGKGLTSTNVLSAQTVTNATWAAEFAGNRAGYTKDQLIAALGEYDPIVRLNASYELAERWLSPAEVNALIVMAENPTNAYQRNGACTALGSAKIASAIPALSRRLKDADFWVRARAGYSLSQMDAADLATSLPDLVDAFITNVTAPYPWDAGFNIDDPLQMANGFLAGAIFGTCGNLLLNSDKNLLYPATRVGLKQPTGTCRGQLNGFVEDGLSQADVQELLPELTDCAKVQAMADTFFSGYPPIAAMKALSRTRVQEGIQVIFENVDFYKSWALDSLVNFGEAARWTLPTLHANIANWEPDGGNYAALTNDVRLLEAATSSSVVYALPKADPQILATPVNTAKAITLTGSSCRMAVPSWAIKTLPAHGTLSGFPPSMTYTPAADYQGMDSFTFTATDSMTNSSPATVHIVVGTGGTGLTGSYYNNMDFTSLVTTRIDSAVNFDWGSTPPASLGAGTYSVRWTGRVLAPETGTYRFSTRTSDGVRLWINGVQVINDWNDQAANLWNDSAAITLTAGQQYHLIMEYYDNASPSTARLYWYMPSRPYQAATVIPQELLFPVAGLCLTSPQDGARFGAQAVQATTVTLAADASALAGTVTSVSFYTGNTLIGTDTTAPYSFTWANVGVGGYDITARAMTSGGLVSTSTVSSITVDSYSVPVTAGLACHFDAAVGVGTDGGFVKTWQDRSGNGHHATFDYTQWNSGTATVAQNQIMSLPAVQVRGGWFDINGPFFAKEQYVVLRSLTATWNGTGAFLGRKSYDFLSVRASSYTLTRGGTGFGDPPLACSRNGVSTMNLAPITNYMVVKITVDTNASPANLAAYPYCQIGRTENESGADWDVAEIIAYTNALSSGDASLVGGYLAAKYGIATSYPATGSLANKATTAITSTSAVLNATLMCNSSNYNVIAYWGPVNGGLNPNNWATSTAVGSWNNVASTNISRTLTNLLPGTTYYFTFAASNATHTVWAAAPLSFATVSTSKDILTFGANVPGSSAVINTAAGTVEWTVPYSTSLTSLAPAYTVSAMASGVPASGTVRNFSTPQTYTITAQDGSTKVYTVTAAVDNTYPSSVNATLTAVEDVATALTAGNFGYADPNSVALGAVQITSLPLLGTLKLSGVAVNNGDIIAAANIGNLTYQSALYGFGTPYTMIGIKVKNANNVWSIADAVMTVNVTYVNHPPTSANASITALGDSVFTFWKTDFPFSDVDAGDKLISVKVTSLPAHGTLKLAGTAISSVPSAEILATNTCLLTYTPNAWYVGPDSFNYQVSDGKDYSADAVMAITVQNPYLIPVLNGSFEITYPGDQTWSDGHWMFIPSPWTASMSNYGRIRWTSTSMPALTNGGTWIANVANSNNVITQDLNISINAGDSLSVTFYVGRDNIGSGGVLQAAFMIGDTPFSQNFDTSTQAVNTWTNYTLTKTVTTTGNLSLRFSNVSGRVGWLDLVSHVTLTPGGDTASTPTSTNATLTVLEDTATALAAGNFGYVDPNSVALAAVRIASLPALGTLKLSGTPVTNGDLPLTVSTANISSLTYLPGTNVNGTAYTTMGIKVMNASNLWSLADTVMTMNVTPVNDAPTSTGGSMSVAVNAIKTFAAGDFPFSDIDAGNTLSAIKVTSLPAHGALSVSIGTEVSAATIGTLTYTPNVGYTGVDAFNFQVGDGTAFSADAVMSISVAIGAPNATNATLTVLEDTVTALSTNNFGYVDPNQFPLAAVQITALPALGSLKLGGTAVTNDTIVSSADITNLTYQAALDENGSPYTTMGIKVMNASNLWSLADTVMTMNVTPVNDAPTSTNATLTVLEDTATALAAGNFGYADPNPLPLAAVQITALPALGTLKLSGTAVTNNEIVTAAMIGNLTYLSATNGNGIAYTTMGIKVMNASNVWSVAAVMTVNVTAVNDAPVAFAQSVTSLLHKTKSITLTGSDTDNDPFTYAIVASPAHGTLSGTPPNVTYTPTGNAVGVDAFTFKVNDGTTNSAPATVTITLSASILAEDFEHEWADNALAKTTNGWHSGIGDKSSITNPAVGYGPLLGGVLYPLVYNHSAQRRILKLNAQDDTLVTPDTDAAFASAKVYVDMMVNFDVCESFPAALANDVNAKALVLLKADGASTNLYVFHGQREAGAFKTPTFTAVLTNSVEPGTWHRLTITLDSTTNGTGAEAFSVRLDGKALVSAKAYSDGWKSRVFADPCDPDGGTWFLSAARRIGGAGTNVTSLARMGFDGGGFIDDVSVTYQLPIFTYGSILMLR